MAEDDPSRDRLLEEINERLKYLESVVRDQVGRLYAIEQRMGIAYRPQAPKVVPQKADLARGGEPAASHPVPAPPTIPETQAGPAGLPWPPSPSLPQKTQADQPVKPPPPPAQPPRPTTASPGPPELKGPPPPAHQGAQKAPPQGPIVPATPPQGKSASAGGAGGLLHQSGSQAPPNIPRHPPTPPKRRVDLETRIGGSWFNWIGVIAICLGVGFFLKLAFERAWIGPTGRVMIGVAIGLGFLIAGERLRKRYAGYAYGLTGGGILLLYLTFFAAFALYELIGHLTAFALMAMVTATASLLSARYSALSIAILGLFGGFLTPILLSTGQDNELGLFGYVALLDLGVLALAYSKHWRVLNYLCFSATVLMVAGYLDAFPWSPEKLPLTMFFLTLFFVIFALLAVMYNVVKRQQTRWLDLALVFINALVYFGTSYELLDDHHHAYLGVFAVLVSSFYLLLGYFTYRRDRQDRLLIFTFLGLAFLFLVLAVPIQLDQHWVTMAWAIEGAVMTWVGLKAGDRTSRYAGLLVFIVAVSHWTLIDMRQFAYFETNVFAPVLNRRAASAVVLVIALAAAAWFYKRFAADIEPEERGMFRGLYMLGANALAVLLLSLDAVDYFEQAKALAAGQDWHEIARLNNNSHLTLSALWSIYGGVALIVGIVRGLEPIRYAALLLLALQTCKVLAFDLPYYDASWHHWSIFNQTFAAFAVLIAALASSAWFYSRSKNVGDEERGILVPGLVAAANLLAVVALSAEAIGHFERAKAIAGEQAINLHSIENTKQLALSAVWIVYASTSLIIGVLRRKKALRIGSLILLALAVFKVLMLDLVYYKAVWHRTIFNQTFASFALLIVAIAVCAWFYHRSKEIGEQERGFVVPLLVCVANVLGVIALSVEAVGHFGRARGDGVDPGELENTKHLVLTALWSVHGAAALVVAIKRGIRPLRWGALALLLITAGKVLVIDLMFYNQPGHTLIFNQSVGALALVIAGLSVGVWSYRQSEGINETELYVATRMLPAVANVLAVVGLSVEAMGYFERAKSLVQAQHGSSSDIVRLDNSEQFWLSALWSIYAGAALSFGIRRRARALRWGALILLTLAIAKLLVVDLPYYDAEFHSLIFNQTFGAFAFVIAALASGVWFYTRSAETEVEERGALIPLSIAVANILAIIGLSAEASGYFKAQMTSGGLLAEAFRDLKLAQQLSLSVIWTIYGGVMLTAGILRRNRMLRMMALILLSLTIVKVFLFDLSSLDTVYRVTSFIVLGAILLGVSFLYQRFRQRWVEIAEAPDSEPGD
jgi:uncharacterized membrane protein